MQLSKDSIMLRIFSVYHKAFLCSNEEIAGSFDTIVNLVRSNENDTKDQESKKSNNFVVIHSNNPMKVRTSSKVLRKN